MQTKLDTRTIALSTLKPLPGNPRKTLSPDDPGWRRLEKSLDEHGYIDPLLLNERTGHVLSGHQRLAVLRARGVAEADVVVVDVPPEREMAVALAMNNHAGDWDRELLVAALDQLTATPHFDVETTGFDVAEVENLLRGLPVDDPDEEDFDLEAELARADEPVTRLGDLIELGPHRLLCGDAGEAADVDRLLDGAPIHLACCDCPYNVKVEPRSNNAMAAGNSSFAASKKTHHQGFDLARHPSKSKPTTRKMRAKDRPLLNDFVSDEEFGKLLLKWFGSIARVLVPGRAFYIWGGYSNFGNYPPALKASGLYFSQCIIWDKQHPVLTRKNFLGAFEVCYHGWREGAAHEFFGPKNVTDLWRVKKIPPQQMSHLTAKPVELGVRAMHYSSRRGENVIDLFGGGGSTLIAAHMTGRRAFMMELDPAYVDIIARRYITFAGEKAVAPDVAERYRVHDEAGTP